MISKLSCLVASLTCLTLCTYEDHKECKFTSAIASFPYDSENTEVGKTKGMLSKHLQIIPRSVKFNMFPDFTHMFS